MAIVYRHRKESNGEVFYIGISKSNIHRPTEKRGRAGIWKNIVKKHGLIAEILITDITITEAKEIEIGLVEYYGRRDMGTGTLVNLTAGGDGVHQWKPTAEQKRKQKEGMKLFWENLSDEDRAKYGGKKGSWQMSEAHKQIVSKTHKGKIVSDATKKLLAKPRIPKTEEQKLHHSMKMRESHQRKKL